MQPGDHDQHGLSQGEHVGPATPNNQVGVPPDHAKHTKRRTSAEALESLSLRETGTKQCRNSGRNGGSADENHDDRWTAQQLNTKKPIGSGIRLAGREGGTGGGMRGDTFHR